MEAAVERLRAAQEVQMDLIEKMSCRLQDHVSYWSAVRNENTLLYAARKAGLKTLGHWPVPSLAASANRARDAIKMQQLCAELAKTEWGEEMWSLADASLERYHAPPEYCLKKGARVVEVTYDDDVANTFWHTVWTVLYLRTEEGWSAATGGTDGEGLYYQTVDGERTYYHFYGSDPHLSSPPTKWEVKDKDMVYVSSTSPSPSPSSSPHFSETPDGGSGSSCGHHGDHRSGSSSGGTHHSNLPSRRVFTGGPGTIRSPLSTAHAFVTSAGSSQRIPTPSDLQSARAPTPERAPESPEAPSPDSSQESAESSTPIFGGTQPCLLLTGGSNQVKCHRHKCKRYHRRKYGHMTTTFWFVGEQGSQRLGQASLLVTFVSTEQRQSFMRDISHPRGIRLQPLSIACE